MSTKYISTKSTVFHPDSETDSQEFVLIYGDEVDTTDDEENGRSEVIYRGRTGWVRTDRLIDEAALELYCIDVGQGDSAFIVTPEKKKILIDGGKGNEAFQFLVWKYRLDRQNPTPIEIDLMVVSHPDDDHIEGLISIIQHQSIHVKKVIHNGIAKYSSGYNSSIGDTQGSRNNKVLLTRHNSINDLENQDLNDTMSNWRTAIIQEPNIEYEAVDSTHESIPIEPNISLKILGPILKSIDSQSEPVYPWLGSVSKTVNGHSVILRLDFKNVRMLFPGDLNERAAKHLIAETSPNSEFNAHVFKAPHHGSHDFHPEFLEAVNPQITFISSGESPDHGHPRANLLGTVGKMSRSNDPLIFSTELVAQFAVDRDAEAPDADTDADPTHPSMLGQARRRFKKRLNGLINIRTDGNKLYCARRVAAGYQFVTYENEAVSPDS